jgi:outer membrane protein
MAGRGWNPARTGQALLSLLLLSSSLYADVVAEPQPLVSAPVSKRDLSLWEGGVLVGGAYVPDYPASDQNRTKFVVFPYIVYRGSVVRSDREGTRAKLWKTRYASLELSAAASFATQSKDDRARVGMPDLDYLLEIGPRLSIPLSELGGRGKLQLFVPIRGVASTDLTNFHHRGFTLTPALFMHVDRFFRPDWIYVSQLTANFANRQLSAYFYDVAPEFALPTRSAYDARAGYLGTDWFNGLAIPLGRKFRLFTGIQLWEHAGSANQASPLFRRQFTFTSIFGIAYTFYESRRPAKKD